MTSWVQIFSIYPVSMEIVLDPRQRVEKWHVDMEL